MSARGGSSELGALVRAQRRRAGLTQDDLATRANLSLRTVRDIEHGRVRHPQAASLRRLAAALGVPDLSGAGADAGAGAGEAWLAVSVLGPLEVCIEDTPVPIATGRQRALLGLLALHSHRVVARDEIVDALWGEHPPRSCANLVHVYVKQLRDRLEPQRRRHEPSATITEAHGGYRLAPHGLRVDLAAFDELVTAAARARNAGAPDFARRHLADALALWRGPVLAGASPRLRAHSPAVAATRRRLDAARTFAHHALAQGAPAQALAVLRPLVAEDPLNESLHAMTMLALAGDGGQLYVNLRGYDQRDPLTAVQALGGVLGSLGVPPDRIPADEDAAASLYRTLLAGRRLLVLLDNARGSGQVRPLLPGAGDCVVLVTSRDTLRGLVARDGARMLTLDVLRRAESVALLRRLHGHRSDDDPSATAELAEVCGHLPLALRIAAAHLVSTPRLAAGELVAALVDGDPFGLLALDDDPDSEVRMVFGHSYRALPAVQRRLFRLLSRAPGTEATEQAAAALAGMTLDEAHQLLDRLLTAHMIVQRGSGRYGYHDLLRRYADSLASGPEHAAEQADALSRIIEWYCAVAGRAAAVLAPSREYPAWYRRPAETPAPFPPERAAVLAFLDRERPALPAVTRLAAQRGADKAVLHLAHLLSTYYQLHGDGEDSLSVYAEGLAAAERLGDTLGTATMHNSLGIANAVLRRLPAAHEHLSQAVRLARAADVPRVLASALMNLGRVLGDLDRPDEALDAVGGSLTLRVTHGLPGVAGS